MNTYVSGTLWAFPAIYSPQLCGPATFWASSWIQTAMVDHHSGINLPSISLVHLQMYFFHLSWEPLWFSRHSAYIVHILCTKYCFKPSIHSWHCCQISAVCRFLCKPVQMFLLQTSRWTSAFPDPSTCYAQISGMNYPLDVLSPYLELRRKLRQHDSS